MSNASIRTIDTGELHASGEKSGDRIELTLRGSTELGSREALDQLFTDAFEAREGVAEVVVDIGGLEYMNSSSFKSLLTWIIKVQDLPDGKRHAIRFLSNPDLHWQERSLHSLVSMVGDLVQVEERAPAS